LVIRSCIGLAYQADVIIVDIDNCDPVTKKFVTFLLAQSNVYYITNDELTPYGLISKNRIYDLSWLVEKFDEEDHDDNQEDDE